MGSWHPNWWQPNYLVTTPSLQSAVWRAAVRSVAVGIWGLETTGSILAAAAGWGEAWTHCGPYKWNQAGELQISF